MFKSGREYFRLGADSYSSLGRVVKKENSVVALRSLLNVFACGKVSSPRLYRLIIKKTVRYQDVTIIELYIVLQLIGELN